MYANKYEKKKEKKFSMQVLKYINITSKSVVGVVE